MFYSTIINFVVLFYLRKFVETLIIKTMSKQLIEKLQEEIELLKEEISDLKEEVDLKSNTIEDLSFEIDEKEHLIKSRGIDGESRNIQTGTLYQFLCDRYGVCYYTPKEDLLKMVGGEL